MPPLDPRKVPRQRRSKATVEAMLDACAEEMGRLGYHALTTHRIAARAGVSVGTLYQYFPNRDAVAGALVIRALERLLADHAAERWRDCIARQPRQPRGDRAPAAQRSLKSWWTSGQVFMRGWQPEAPHLFRLPAAASLQGHLIELSQEIHGCPAVTALTWPTCRKPTPWIIGHMVSSQLMLQGQPARCPERGAPAAHPRDCAADLRCMALDRREGQRTSPSSAAA